MVLYEMLTGKPPFGGDNTVAVATKQMSETPAPPSSVNRRVPRALDAVVMRALSLDPDMRQPTADDFRADLLASAPATGDPDATVAIPPPDLGATAVARPASSTTVLPPLVEEPPLRRPDPEDDRRRRAAVIAILAVVAIAAILLFALTAGDDGGGGTRTVPAVVGFTVADATRAVEDAGLRSRVVQEDRPGAVADRVAEQRPPAGDVVATGSEVQLIVRRATSTSSSPISWPAPSPRSSPGRPGTSASP